MSALDKPWLYLVVVQFEVYFEHMAQVSVVEAFLEGVPRCVVGSYMIYNSLVDQMVLLPKRIERQVHPQHVSSVIVDHKQIVMSSPSPCVP